MAKWGSADFRELEKLQARLKKLSETDKDVFCRDCCKELAARLLALVIPNTPVGVYDGSEYVCVTGMSHKANKVTGKKGGTLRRGWTAGKSAGATAYAQAMRVKKSGNTYSIEIINPVEYASYVEFGHRTRNGTGWVPGHYMLTISEEKLRQMSPVILERKLQAKLREVFNG